MNISANNGTLVSIAGFDPTCGAGLQADLNVFRDFGFYGLSVATAVTVQDSRQVLSTEVLRPSLVMLQLQALYEDFPINGYKLGMLGTSEIAEKVADFLQNKNCLSVIDPLRFSSSGYELITGQDYPIYLQKLFPFATAVTPNRREAEILLDTKIDTIEQAQLASAALAEYGPLLVVITGIIENGKIHDVAHSRGLTKILSADVRDYEVHGTGCVYSSALLCALDSGQEPFTALQTAFDYTHEKIDKAKAYGQGSRLIG